MERSVVFTGDDYGFSRGVNCAIIEAHERGVLSRASLMVTGEAFDGAVALARSHPRLRVGLHLVLVCGRSALSRAEIPHLVDAGRSFSSHPVPTGLRYQFDSRARRELRLEIRAQLEKFRRTGLRLSHVDGHLHMHMHPVVLRILAGLAPEFGIGEIRLPSEELDLALELDRSRGAEKLIWFLVFRGLRRAGERCLRPAGIHYRDRVYGLLASGRMTEAYLTGLIPRIRANRVEIYSHPDTGSAELSALVSDRVREGVALGGFTLE